MRQLTIAEIDEEIEATIRDLAQLRRQRRELTAWKRGPKA